MELELHLDSLDGLSAELQPLYVQENGKYRLNIKGYKDPQALLNARDREKAEKQAAKARVAELETELEDLNQQLTEARSKKSPDLAALEASYKDKIAKIEKAKDEEISRLTSFLEKTHRSDVAQRIASELSDSPDLLLPHIEKRLAFEIGASGPETRVLDANGQPSALTVEELAAEFKSDKRYAAAIRGSQASGGGAANNGKPGSAVMTVEQFNALDTEARLKMHRENPTEFRRLSDAAKKAAHA